MVLPGTAVAGVMVLPITFCPAALRSAWLVEMVLLGVPDGSVSGSTLAPTGLLPLLSGAGACAAADISIATKINARVVCPS